MTSTDTPRAPWGSEPMTAEQGARVAEVLRSGGVCMCEHADHFEDGTRHPYGARRPIHSHHSIVGAACQECAESCLVGV